jgi:hypothetical protein
MATTATPDVEGLQFKLGELPPGITPEHLRSHVVRAGWRTSGKELINMPARKSSPTGTLGCSLPARVQGTYDGSPSA